METLAPPWLDLPAHLSDNILERLPLSDYARFPAVCRRWRSVQTSHRRRHSPSPPPTLPLPWLVEALESGPSSRLLSCYSPFEDAAFSIPLPSSSSSSSPDLSLFSRGWTLSFDDLGNPSLFHPISASTIDLPPLITPSDYYIPFAISLVDRVSGVKIQIPPSVRRRCSSFTVSPPPNYAVSTIATEPSGVRIFLLRSSDPSWVELDLPGGANARDLTTLKQTVPIRGKHYHLCMQSWDAPLYNVLVVDALSTPAATVQYYEMTPLSPMPEETGFMRGSTQFVELSGELLLVREVVEVEDWRATVGFQLFRADLGRKMWVEVKSLGDDRVLMFHACRAVWLSVADIGAARGNCIYFSKGMQHEQDVRPDSGEAPWNVFDLATGRVTDLLLPNASEIEKSLQRLFVPSLC